MEQTYHYNTLPNGLRIVYQRRQGSVAYCGLAVQAGSRDDGARLGLAHFVEHTIFKGTRRRKAWHILNRMERVGGELNAYTTKEETLVYSVFPSGNMARAVELIADLVCNSTFPEHEIDKEREVVVEEIDSYRDSPADAIYDDFEDLIFADTPLGHNILGNEETLQSLTGADCLDYVANLYVPTNMVLFAVDSIPAERFFALSERYFGVMHHPLRRLSCKPIVAAAPFEHLRDIDAHQSHTVVGTTTFGMHDSRKYALLLANNILGGPGMNSTLNVAIRERRGYAYTVESTVTLLSDVGLFTIYFGSDHRHTAKCRRLIDDELRRIADGGITERALNAAKKQYIGQLIVSSESSENRALSLGKEVLNFGTTLNVEAVANRIRAVSADDIRAVGQMLCRNLSTLTFR